MATTHYSAALLRTLAVQSGSDPRTVAKVLRGEAVRGVAGDRIRAALARCAPGDLVGRHASPCAAVPPPRIRGNGKVST